MHDLGIVRVASPCLDQAMSIARVIRNTSGSNIHIRGLTLPGEIRPVHRGPFDSFHRTALGDLSGSIPAGGTATAALLERGDINVGAVTMTQNALRFYSKPWSLSLARNCGIPVPDTWTDSCDDLQFPVFTKPQFEGSAGTRKIARSRDELPGDVDMIYQEYIDSPGTYGVGFIADSGKITAYHTHYERESYPSIGGSAVVAERYNDERLVKYVRAIISASEYSGWGLAEFKYCPSRDDFVFMEINAKFWASCILAFHNEPRFTELFFNGTSALRPVTRMLFINRALARGWGYTIRSLPREMILSRNYYGEGAWRTELAKLVVPSGVVRKIRDLMLRT